MEKCHTYCVHKNHSFLYVLSKSEKNAILTIGEFNLKDDYESNIASKLQKSNHDLSSIKPN
jgi:hypothetical protein